MICKYCDKTLEEWQTGTHMCNNCWEIYSRFRSGMTKETIRMILEDVYGKAVFD